MAKEIELPEVWMKHCPWCGGWEFSWAVEWKPDLAHFGDGYLKAGTFRKALMTEKAPKYIFVTRMCNHCGNIVQFSGKPFNIRQED